MPTPVVYLDGRLDPFAHLPEHERSTSIEVFYSTNRTVAGDHYGNDVDHVLRLGKATMRIGEPGDDWASLADASTIHPRPRPIPVRLMSSEEIASDDNETGRKNWATRVDQALRRTATRDIVIYVHGAKVGFPHSCAFVAELDHFAGRDLTPVAFDWPTHQEIFSYLDRVDLDHARRSSARLVETIELLADRTSVRNIHMVSWSAGARVLSRALAELDERTAGKAAPDRYRIGTVVFAASDVPVSDFIGRLPAIHRLSKEVIVYVSNEDFALRWSARLMGGGRRLGLAPEQLSREELALLRRMPRLEVIDTSLGRDLRGFNITGHRYWFQHPWVNSDLVLALRTGARAQQRGLRAAPTPGVWYFGSGYAERIGEIGHELTDGEW